MRKCFNSAEIHNNLNLYTYDTKATKYIMPTTEFQGKQIPKTNGKVPHNSYQVSQKAEKRQWGCGEPDKQHEPSQPNRRTHTLRQQSRIHAIHKGRQVLPDINETPGPATGLRKCHTSEKTEDTTSNNNTN